MRCRRPQDTTSDPRCGSEANDPKAQKYQELFAKDKEMSELIDTFEEKKVRCSWAFTSTADAGGERVTWYFGVIGAAGRAPQP